MQIDIIGVPIDLGADRRGVDMGPSAIRYAHLQKKLEDIGYEVRDQGNVEVPIAEMCKITNPKLKYLDCIIPMSRRVAGAVATSIQTGNFPLILGGDHSLSIGSVRGAARNRKIGVIWIDAHGDFNTAETTPSGNIHGMSLAILAGLGDKSLVQLWDEAIPVIDPGKIAVIGARDLDDGEKANLKKAGSLVMGMEQIDRYGMVNAVEKAIERVSRDVDGIFLSLDLDSLDPQHAPGVGTPV
ncbi:MAG TPA: arginase, partial [Anaerolineales bacterium]|nr:arginase [Anaerolineales bacterium]